MVPTAPDATATDLPELAVATWGRGPRAVLVHGGGAGGAAAFAQQRPLAERFELVLPDRPETGLTPRTGSQDALRDGRLVAGLLGDGAHLVGHSYGAVVAMIAAALRPDHVRSLVVVEPPAFALAADDPQVMTYWNELAGAVADPDAVLRVRRFARAAGLAMTVPDVLPPPLQALAEDLRTMRQPWDVPLDLAALRRLAVPKVIVSGGHRDAFERLCDRLAGLVAGRRAVLPGAGHTVQDTGEPFNGLLARTWTDGDAHAAEVSDGAS